MEENIVPISVLLARYCALGYFFVALYTVVDVTKNKSCDLPSIELGVISL
jgi:hypothetical protein